MNVCRSKNNDKTNISCHHNIVLSFPKPSRRYPDVPMSWPDIKYIVLLDKLALNAVPVDAVRRTKAKNEAKKSLKIVPLRVGLSYASSKTFQSLKWQKKVFDVYIGCVAYIKCQILMLL